MSRTDDAGVSFWSKHNRGLANLQTYTTDGARQADGTLGASYQVNDLIGAGLQDNGNVWALHGRTPWRRIDGGDGGTMTFTRGSQVIRRNSLTEASTFRRGEWDDGAQSLVHRGDIPITRPRPGPSPPAVLNDGGVVIVNAPIDWDVFGAKIYAFGWSGPNVFSFWNPTGFASWRWEFETALPLLPASTTPALPAERISAGGSANSQVSFFGTTRGRIFMFDKRTGTATLMPVRSNIADPTSYGVNRIAVLSDTLAFALVNGSDAEERNGVILQSEGTRWTQISGKGLPTRNTRWFAIEADWTASTPVLLACTDDKVYRSTNLGLDWEDVSAGLPRRAHLADIRFVVFPNGTKRFYLGTFGRSVWFTDVR